MNEQNLIEHARVKFMRDTGLTPTKVYLGSKTHENLIKAMGPYLIHDASLPKGERSSFMGLKVYKVDESDYIAIGQ